MDRFKLDLLKKYKKESRIVLKKCLPGHFLPFGEEVRREAFNVLFY